MAKPTKGQLKAFATLQKTDPQAEVTWSKNRTTPNRLRGRLSKPATGAPDVIVKNFLKTHKTIFELKSPEKELKLKDIIRDRSGNQHVRYQQMLNNLPVFGAELIVHLDCENVVSGVTGKFTPKIKINEKPTISEEKAQEIILKHNAKNEAVPGRKPLLLVFLYKKKPYLAWHLTVHGMDKDIESNDMPAVWEYFLDANTGKILFRYNNLQHHTRTTGLGNGYYSGAVSVNTVHNHGAGNYELEDQWIPTSARIYTHDCDSGPTPGPMSVDSNNNWGAANQGQEVDCHVYSRMVYDYFLNMHGRDSYDDAGADMHIHAHFGVNTKNAYWSPTEQLVKIGDGDGITRDPYCTLDVIAHEWTHAITEHTAGLVYSNESGALNESISDVFAALIDGDWLHGEDYWLPATAPASRNLADPTNGGQYDTANPIDSVIAGHQPDHMTDKYTGTGDYGGVHINSGITNKAAHLIAMGGTHRGITICEGLGRDVLGRLYYQTLTNYLISSSDFEDMRDAVLDSLSDLYAGDARYNRWRASIINAFAAVGIGTAVTCPITCWTTPTLLCPPAPSLCRLAPVFACPPAPTLCYVAPARTCPPSPSLCRLAPSITCPPSPTTICPPAPSRACSIAPHHGCLPGPDPLPYIPDIRVIKDIRVKDVKEISGIGKESSVLLKKSGIKTVKNLVAATKDAKAIKDLAKKTGISEKRLANWSKKANILTK